MASQINNLAIVYSIVYWATDQRKHQSSAALSCVRGIHRWPVNSPYKGHLTRKMFPFDDVIMNHFKMADVIPYNLATIPVLRHVWDGGLSYISPIIIFLYIITILRILQSTFDNSSFNAVSVVVVDNLQNILEPRHLFYATLLHTPLWPSHVRRMWEHIFDHKNRVRILPRTKENHWNNQFSSFHIAYTLF